MGVGREMHWEEGWRGEGVGRERRWGGKGEEMGWGREIEEEGWEKSVEGGGERRHREVESGRYIGSGKRVECDNEPLSSWV